MCGRISFNKNLTELAEHFQVPANKIPADRPRPKFNIPPSTQLPVIVAGPEITFMRWGLTERGFPINLRTDNLMRGPNARLLAKNRCIIPVDGFYEWNAKKEPTRFEVKGKSIFPMAAIFTAHGFSLFTCDPNAVVAQVHDRMPVILQDKDVDRWLDPTKTDLDQMFMLLGPYPGDQMTSQAVDKSLNKPANDFFRLRQ